MIILIHIGQDLPDYLPHFIKQLRLFNSRQKVFFLVNQRNTKNEIFSNNDIETYPIEELINDRINLFISKFGHGSQQTLTKKIEYASSDYWCAAGVRLFFVYEFAKKQNIQSFFHFENDIMIYDNIEEMENKIKSQQILKDKILITRGTNNKIMTGFMYVNSLLILNHMLDTFMNYLNDIIFLFRHGIDHLNEMALLHVYQVNNQSNIVELPVFPNDSQLFYLFNSVFDPATYGQILDGTPGDPGKSILPDSIIRNEIQKRKKFRIDFEILDELNLPFLVLDDIKYKISSLHIHSKRLWLFSSLQK